MTIKEIMDSLPDDKKSQLMYAFEHDFTQFVELPDNKYIGVNTSHIQHLTKEQVAGNWYVGEIKK
jgi:hypothetical protein